MKFIKTAGLCLASMLVIGMALAGGASAAVPLWLLCLEGAVSSNTKYIDSSCTKTEAGNPKSRWESVELGAKSDTVDIVALSLRLEDKKGELGAAVEVKCDHVTGIGLISNRNLLLVREAKVAKPSEECIAKGSSIFEACKTSTLESVEGDHLPWKVEVYQETEKKFISRIQPDGNGEPGWTVRCSGQTDECLSEGAGTLEEASGKNEVTAGSGILLVFAEFLKKHAGKCSVGGAGTGKVAGFLVILLSTGLGLSLAP